MYTLENLIHDAEIDAIVDISRVSSLSYVRFDYDKTERLYSYSYWGRRSNIPRYPGGDIVKTWKTLAGAKNHFLKMHSI